MATSAPGLAFAAAAIALISSRAARLPFIFQLPATSFFKAMFISRIANLKGR
jgi:hypothetical protein